MSRCFKILFGLICGLCLWEASIRLFVSVPRNHKPDSWLVSLRNPGSEALTSHEGFARFRFNSLGLRGRDLGNEERPRVVVLGDSFVQGMSVVDEDLFTAVAERNLKRQGWRGQVVNAGRSGADLFQYSLFLERFGQRLDPDLLVIEVTRYHYGWLTRSKHFRYEIDEAGNIEFVSLKPKQNSHIRESLRPLSYYSAFVNVLVGRFHEWRGGGGVVAAGQPVAGTPTGMSSREEQLWLACLKTIKGQYPNSVILYIPIYSYPEFVTSLAREERTRSLASQAGIPFYSARRELEKDYKKWQRPHRGFHNSVMGTGHLNEDGHRVIGSALEAVVVEHAR